MPSATPLYVLARKHAQPDGRINCQALCESLPGEPGGTGAALVIYLSPLEACIDAVSGRMDVDRYEVMPAHTFTPETMIRERQQRHMRGIASSLHMTWTARDGQVAVDASGSLRRFSFPRMYKVMPMIKAIRIEPGADLLECYRRLYEAAGVGSGAESHLRLLACSSQERHARALRAIERLPGTTLLQHDPPNQLALYDFEAEQWHFLPPHVLRGITEDIARKRQPDAG